MKPLPAVDVAPLPAWYVGSAAARRFVASAIAPRRVFAIDTTPAEAARLEPGLNPAGVSVTFLTKPGPAYE